MKRHSRKKKNLLNFLVENLMCDFISLFPVLIPSIYFRSLTALIRISRTTLSTCAFGMHSCLTLILKKDSQYMTIKFCLPLGYFIDKLP